MYTQNAGIKMIMNCVTSHRDEPIEIEKQKWIYNMVNYKIRV